MAKNTVTIDIQVNGKMQKATLSAKKLQKALQDVGMAGNQAAQGAANADRNLKGLSAQSANGTKNFSKMAQGMSGFLVPAYATLAANVFALSAAFNFLKSAGDLRALQAGQEAYARQTGTSMVMLTKNIQAATGGLVAYEEAAQAAAIGNAAGLTADQLTRLGAIAKNAGTILGRDVTDAFNRLTRGAIKAEPELLDELGIIVRLADASERYADALDINVNSLTTFQKSQAVVNATIAEGESKFRDVGDAVNNVARLGASLQDTFKTVKEGIAGIANFIAGALNDSIYALVAALGLLGKSFLGAIIPAGPALKNVAAGAVDAQARIKEGINKKSATGQAIGKNDFGPKTMYNLERSAKAAQSSIRNESKLTQLQMQKDLRLIKANMILTSAEGKNAFTKMFANWRAQLLLFQAEHGRVMGTVKAVTAAAAATMSRLLSFAAWIGLAIILVSFIKKGLDYFKDPALRKAEETAVAAKEAFEESTKSVEKLRSELEPAGSAMEKIVQQANLLANFTWNSFNSVLNNLRATADEFDLSGIDLSAIDQDSLNSLKNMTTELDNLRKVGKKTADEVGGGLFDGIVARRTQTSATGGRVGSLYDSEIEELETKVNTVLDGIDMTGLKERVLPLLKDSIPAALDNLDLQFSILDEAGRDTAGLRDMAGTISQLAKDMQGGNMSGVEFARTLVRLIGEDGTGGLLDDLRKGTRAVTSDLMAERNAFKSLTQTLEAFTESSKKLDLKDSPYTQLIGQVESAEQAIATLSASAGNKSVRDFFVGGTEEGTKAFDDGIAQYNALLRLAGLQGDATADTLDSLKFQAVLEERIARFKDIAVTMEVKKHKLQLAGLKANRGATKLQAQQVKYDMAVLNAQQALNAKIAEKTQMELTNQKMSAEQERIYNAEKEVLEEQLEIMKEQADVAQRLAMVTKNAFESGLSSGINDFITGKEGSLRDGLKTLAKGVLEAVSKQISDYLAKSVSDFLFGEKDPAKDMAFAMQAGGQSAAQAIEAAMIRGADAIAAKLGISTGGATAGTALPPLPDNVRSDRFATEAEIAANANPLGNLTMGPSLDELQRSDPILGNQAGLRLNGALSQMGSQFGVGSVEDDMIRSSFGGAGSSPQQTLTYTGQMAEGQGSGLGEIMTELKDSMSELTIETASNVTAGAALLAGLTGNSKAAEALAKITAAMKAYQMIKAGIEKMLGIKRTTETGALIMALNLNTKSNLVNAAVPFAKGGIMSNGVQQYSSGGIAKGSKAGYPALLHGTEAVVPLPDNRSIPVDLKGAAGGQTNNNVVVNVGMDGSSTTSTTADDSDTANRLGNAVATAVQTELQKQKRSGGILSPYGVA